MYSPMGFLSLAVCMLRWVSYHWQFACSGASAFSCHCACVSIHRLFSAHGRLREQAGRGGQVKGAAPAVSEAQAEALLGAAAPFRDAYLAAALGRLNDSIAAAFPGGTRPLPAAAELQKCIGSAPGLYVWPPRAAHRCMNWNASASCTSAICMLLPTLLHPGRGTAAHCAPLLKG